MVYEIANIETDFSRSKMPNLQDNSGKHDKDKRFFSDGETVKIIDGIFAVFRHTDILCPMAERKFRKSQVAVFFQKLRGNIADLTAQ